MKKINNPSNIKIHKDYLQVRVNPKIYTLDIVYSAAYALLDKAYVVLDGDPKKEIIVEIRPKKNSELVNLGNDFNDELLNYAVYKKQSEKNAMLRQAIIQRALLTNGFEEGSEEDFDDIDDPEGILVPWEEKYGKEK